MRKICFVTGTRAEYGLLSRLIRLVKDSRDCELQIIATNMHLMPEYGNTYQEILKDGFSIDEMVPMPKISDDDYGVVASMAVEMQGVNDAFKKLTPDMIVILGDRYEMLVVASVAMLNHIPIAHLHGGEITEGAMDDSIRHAITKLSHLHFTATEEHRNRVIQLGEQPDRVFNVGAIGVENLKRIPITPKEELEKDIDFILDENTIQVTYHPVTLGTRTIEDEIVDFLKAMDNFPQLRILFTMPNSDQGGDIIRKHIEEYCVANSTRCKAFTSLGMKRYISVIQYVRAVVGNSSSGLIEVPSAHVPTLNIGDRQKRRTRGESVYDCGSSCQEIVEGMNIILSDEFRNKARTAENPYEKEGTAEKIYKVISTVPLYKLIHKSFYDL